MAKLSIRIDDGLKESADIPFDFNIDPFYSEKNMKILRESIADADAGKLTEHELIEF